MGEFLGVLTDPERENLARVFHLFVGNIIVKILKPFKMAFTQRHSHAFIVLSFDYVFDDYTWSKISIKSLKKTNINTFLSKNVILWFLTLITCFQGWAYWPKRAPQFIWLFFRILSSYWQTSAQPVDWLVSLDSGLTTKTLLMSKLRKYHTLDSICFAKLS